MDNKDHETTDSPLNSGNDSSDFLFPDDKPEMIDFDGLFSRQFTNISPLYTSPDGPTRLFTATRFGKRFIIKALKEQYRSDPLCNVALAKEFEIGISLDHPNIRRTVSLEDIDGIGRAIVLEYVDGRTLRQLIDSGNLSVDDARSIARQIISALGYLHSKQVYHRDLKPTNIIVAYQGNVVKIIDFNYSDSNEFVVLKNPAGTQNYVAPELSEPGAASTAVSDIFSLGVILDKLARASADDALAEIAEKCTQPSPARRPQFVSLIRIPQSRRSVSRAVSRFLSSRVLTIVLICVCTALAAAIAFMLIPRL